MPLDEDDLRYLLEIKATFQKALEGERDTWEVARLQTMINDIESRISDERITPLEQKPLNNSAPIFSVGQLVRVARNGEAARILDIKYTGVEWLYYVTVPPDPPSTYKDWFLESQLIAA